ncbi:lipase family protein [Leifsonia flava]|uniref:lipase family protein n=1 Tax=Orlajensenia leifsoniae TaxID=2561933 RepID=UPI0019574E73|nr:lipase family protein [Leifsonia flava]
MVEASDGTRSRRRRRRWVVTVLAALVATVIAVFTFTVDRRVDAGLIEEWQAPAFYGTTGSEGSAPPGTLVRSERLLSAPTGSEAWRILYHSTDALGHDILTSGVVVAPVGAAPPEGRTIVSWGHPTTGAAQRCAPSVGVDPFLLIEGLGDFIDAGYVVVAADYSGMGAAGPDSYLIGATEGGNLLDAARVARTLPTGASDRLVLWGHSQGGHAALFAGQMAAEYAPELVLEAVAVAAPATDLGSLMNADIGTVSGVTISAYAFAAFSSVYGPSTPDAQLTDILTPDGAAAVPAMAKLCLFGQNKQLHAIATPLIGKYLTADPATTEPWKTMLAENTPGAAALPVPLFVAQGLTDTLVHPDLTSDFVQRARALGVDVVYDEIADTGHGEVALRAVPKVLPWLASVGGGPR